MQKNLNRHLKKKLRTRRFLYILLFTFIAAVTLVFLRECSQRFDEPYNKGYHPVDKSSVTSDMRDLP